MPVEPRRRARKPQSSRDPRRDRDCERGRRKQKVRGDPQEIPADRLAVKPQGPGKAEMPIDKRIDAFAAARKVSARYVANDGLRPLPFGLHAK